MNDDRLARFKAKIAEEYAQRFPRSREHFQGAGAAVLDSTSHAIRWNDPFMPALGTAAGGGIEVVDGHRLVDYWQGHFANLLGHNPPLIREALTEALAEGRGLQSGMVHTLEGELAEQLLRATGTEALRFTTSGSLGTFYAVLLARGFTGRRKVIKVAGGWHGSQPFGLKGVAARGTSFDHMETEGLSVGTAEEIVLTRFNDVEDLRRAFAEHGDRAACFIVEPMLGAGGGFFSTGEYVREARRLTEEHGVLLLCDEIITGFRFRAGDLAAAYDVRPDLLILGKVMGGGMPVAAVAGRRDVLSLCSRRTNRVKFEGGTYSAHELSLTAAGTLVEHTVRHEEEVYAHLGDLGARLRTRLADLAARDGLPVQLLGVGHDVMPRSSLIYMHPVAADAPPVTCPEDLAQGAHPWINHPLLKSVLMLEGVSVHYGIGALSTAHTDDDLDRTLAGVEAAFQRLRDAGLC